MKPKEKLNHREVLMHLLTEGQELVDEVGNLYKLEGDRFVSKYHQHEYYSEDSLGLDERDFYLYEPPKKKNVYIYDIGFIGSVSPIANTDWLDEGETFELRAGQEIKRIEAKTIEVEE